MILAVSVLLHRVTTLPILLSLSTKAIHNILFVILFEAVVPASKSGGHLQSINQSVNQCIFRPAAIGCSELREGAQDVLS